MEKQNAKLLSDSVGQCQICLHFRACAINIMNIISSFAWISQFTPLGSPAVWRFHIGSGARTKVTGFQEKAVYLSG